jgi:hypothetical protein
MSDPGAVAILVSSLLFRPRHLAPSRAEDVYRAGETLALGLDIALAAAGIKRTSLIAQRPNRVAFSESWAPPGGWGYFEHLLLALDADGPLPAHDAPSDPALDEMRILIAEGKRASRFPHLLGHAAPPWYYVPREFPRPLLLPEPQPQSHAGAGPGRLLSVGSVTALARELEDLEPLLAARGLDPLVWFPAPLLEATAVSLETGLVITMEPSAAGTRPAAPLREPPSG